MCSLGRPLVRTPMHLVDPVTSEHMLFDVRSEAVCPDWVLNVVTLIE